MTATVYVPRGYMPVRVPAAVMAGFYSLTVTQRQVLFLYGVEHLPLREAGHHLGLSPEVIRAIFTGACQRLAVYGTTRPEAQPTARTAEPAASADDDPARLLNLAEVFRLDALRTAGRSGLNMPIEQVRIGEEILTGGRWETVEVIQVDGWCCGIPPVPGHRHQVSVCTDAHSDDEQALTFDAGTPVRVRQAVAS